MAEGGQAALHLGDRLVDLGQVLGAAHRQGPVQFRKRAGRGQFALAGDLAALELPPQLPLEAGQPVAVDRLAALAVGARGLGLG